MLKKAPKLDQSKLPMNVTVPGTRARQDLLAQCATHGARFHATNGDALNFDDVFIMLERKVREKRIEVLEKKTFGMTIVHKSKKKQMKSYK